MTEKKIHEPIPEAKSLTIPWPQVRPLGVPLTATALKEAWDTVFGPMYAQDQSAEMRCLAAALRAVYSGMYGVTGEQE